MKKKVLVIVGKPRLAILDSHFFTFLENIHFNNYEFTFVFSKNMPSNIVCKIEEKLKDINVLQENIKWIGQSPVYTSYKHSQEEKETLMRFYESHIKDMNPDLILALTRDSSYLSSLYPNTPIYNIMEGDIPVSCNGGEGILLLDNTTGLLGIPYLDKHPEQLQSDRLEHSLFQSMITHNFSEHSMIETKITHYINNIKKKYKKVVFFPIDFLGIDDNSECLTIHGSYEKTIHEFSKQISDDTAVIFSFHPLDKHIASYDDVKKLFPVKDNFYYANFDLQNLRIPKKLTSDLVQLCDHIVVMNSKAVYLAICCNKPISLLSDQKIGFYPHIFPVPEIKNINAEELSIFPAHRLLYWLAMYERFTSTADHDTNTKQFEALFSQDKTSWMSETDKANILEEYTKNFINYREDKLLLLHKENEELYEVLKCRKGELLNLYEKNKITEDKINRLEQTNAALNKDVKHLQDQVKTRDHKLALYAQLLSGNTGCIIKSVAYIFPKSRRLLRKFLKG